MSERSKNKPKSGAIHDRRSYSRVYYQHELTLQDGNGVSYRGAFNDVSLKGMLFNSDRLPPKGAKVTGIVHLGSFNMVIKGVVMAVQPDRGAAVRFEEMDVESFSHLRRLVSLNMGDSDIIDEEFFATL
ncbi:MAG: PilZ domain-containing protein [Magnetococcales bacterium]|nr:PilZ domain-containing protein [Magnetococcales bacterium]